MATIKDIAQQTGLSTATVSRVINHSGYASEESKKLILDACRELNYPLKETNELSQKFKRTNPNIIGIVVPDITIPYYYTIAKSLEELAYNQGILTIVCSSGENSARELEIIYQLKSFHIGGLIISPVISRARDNRNIYDATRKAGIPTILFDRDVSFCECDSVCFDDYVGSQMATNALIDAGHTKIALFLASPVIQNYIDRYNGYIDALNNHALPIHNEYILYGGFSGTTLSDTTYAETLRLLREHPDVTAIISSNNMMTIGCMRAFRTLGLEFGKDISLVSFDSSFLDSIFPGEITTILRHTDQISQEIFNLLTERMAQSTLKGRKSAPQKITLKPSLIKRKSIAVINTETNYCLPYIP